MPGTPTGTRPTWQGPRSPPEPHPGTLLSCGRRRRRSCTRAACRRLPCTPCTCHSQARGQPIGWATCADGQRARIGGCGWPAAHLLRRVHHHARWRIHAASSWPSAAVDWRREREEGVRVAEGEAAGDRVADGGASALRRQVVGTWKEADRERCTHVAFHLGRIKHGRKPHLCDCLPRRTRRHRQRGARRHLERESGV